MQSNTDEIDGLFGWAAVARSRRDGRLNTFAYRFGKGGLVSRAWRRDLPVLRTDFVLFRPHGHLTHARS
jgi:hypothetical protein